MPRRMPSRRTTRLAPATARSPARGIRDTAAARTGAALVAGLLGLVSLPAGAQHWPGADRYGERGDDRDRGHDGGAGSYRDAPAGYDDWQAGHDPYRGCASGTADARPGHRPRSLQVVGLASDGRYQRLVCFNENAPGQGRPIGAVSGLVQDTRLVGIDFRVQDGQLYGVGDRGGVYRLDTSNAAARLVNRTSVALEGTAFGVDFNPAADRLRIVSNTGQNLRHDLAGTTVVDGRLNYNAPDAAQGVVAAAYTNNDLAAATATTLFVLDTQRDQVALQSPPNAGVLAATGSLGIDAVGDAGFDIYSALRGDTTADVRALAVLTPPDGATGLYAVNLLTGRAVLRGRFSERDRIVDIAIPLRQH